MLVVAAAAGAQQKNTVLKIEGENLFMLQEFILVLAEEEGKVVVNLSPPEGSLPEEYKDIDIRGRDVIRMMNGKRVVTTAAVKEIYEKLKTGEEIKFGIMRGEEMFIVSFPKADPEKVQEGMMIRKVIVDENGKEAEAE